MADESPKTWWQTIPGFMTGIAALITAVCGLIVLLRQSNPPVPSTPAQEAAVSHNSGAQGLQPAQSHATSWARPPAHPPSSSHTKSDAETTPTIPWSPLRIASLPAKREYVLGTLLDKARYVLVSANIAPRSAESDKLIVKIRFMSEGRQGYQSELSSSQFQLLIDERSVRPVVYFMDLIPTGDSRDKDVVFFVESSITHAVLRIQVGVSSAEIPLELSPPEAHG
jgi:hypothetical protein